MCLCHEIAFVEAWLSCVHANPLESYAVNKDYRSLVSLLPSFLSTDEDVQYNLDEPYRVGLDRVANFVDLGGLGLGIIEHKVFRLFVYICADWFGRFWHNLNRVGLIQTFGWPGAQIVRNEVGVILHHAQTFE